MIGQLKTMAKSMKCHGMIETLDQRIQQAKEDQLSYEELLSILLQDETQYRDQQMLKRLIKNAQFEQLKSFDALDLKNYESTTVQAIRSLMMGQFIKDRNHIVIMGPVGTGKTHVAQALGLMACKKGKKVYFIRANVLLMQFHKSRADESILKLYGRLKKYDVFIIDDFGLKTLSAEQSSDLYDLIAQMHVTTSLIFTTNRKIEHWSEIFHDPVMANAALDRIINRSFRLILTGESYRKKFIPKYQKESDI